MHSKANTPPVRVVNIYYFRVIPDFRGWEPARLVRIKLNLANPDRSSSQSLLQLHDFVVLVRFSRGV